MKIKAKGMGGRGGRGAAHKHTSHQQVATARNKSRKLF